MYFSNLHSEFLHYPVGPRHTFEDDKYLQTAICKSCEISKFQLSLKWTLKTMKCFMSPIKNVSNLKPLGNLREIFLKSSVNIILETLKNLN